EGTTSLIQDIENTIEGMSGAMYSLNLGGRVENLLTDWTNSVFEDLPAIISQSLTVILLAPFLTFFLLKDGRKITKGLFSLVPNNLFELTLNLYHQINMQMGQFVRARILEALIVGLVVWAGLW